MESAIPFPEETVYLEHVMQCLDEAFADAEGTVGRLDREYNEFKRYLVEYRNETDAHEKLQSERLLEQTDKAGAQAAENCLRILKLKDSPYFARIDFAPRGGSPTSFYIGRFGFSHKRERLVVDWRAPISGIYYDYGIGPASYQAPARKVEGELTLKRQFKIADGRMEYAVDVSDALQDDVLVGELAYTSDEKMKSIISTIQREQNAIIRNESVQTLLIQGVAGSGKTSIALHRVAYLLYRFKDTLKAQDVAIVSPNKVFSNYISNVIPELGEEPIVELGLDEIAEQALDGMVGFESARNPLEVEDADWQQRVRFKSTPGFVALLQEYTDKLAERIFDPGDLVFGRQSVEAGWIRDRFDAYAPLSVKERLGCIASDIRGRLRSGLTMGKEPPKQGAILKSLNKMLAIKSPLALYADFFRSIGAEHLFKMPGKNTLEYDDVFPSLYLLAAYQGLSANRQVKHLVIDEMQDYTPIQHVVLGMLFPAGQKTILGDFGQALNPYHGYGLDDVAALYPGAELVHLNTSYRSTWEIMEFAKRIGGQSDLQAVRRHGDAPRVVPCNDREEEMRALVGMVREFERGGRASLGIVAKTDADARAAYEALAAICGVHLLTPESTRFSAGVSVASIRMAKGLEFDEVIVLDTDSTRYGEDFDRHLLYIACTRAMHGLTLLHTGEASPFLPVGDV